jgi:hypothetical protein
MIKKVETTEIGKTMGILDFSEITPEEISNLFKITYTVETPKVDDGTRIFDIQTWVSYGNRDFMLGHFTWYLNRETFEFEDYYPFRYRLRMNRINPGIESIPKCLTEKIEEQNMTDIRRVEGYKKKGIASYLEYLFLTELEDKNYIAGQRRITTGIVQTERKEQLNVIGVGPSDTIETYLSKFKAYCDRKGFTYNPGNIIRTEDLVVR